MGPKDYVQLGGFSHGEKELHLKTFLGTHLENRSLFISLINRGLRASMTQGRFSFGLLIEIQYIPIHFLIGGPRAAMIEEGFSCHLAPLIPYSGRGGPKN